MKINFTFTIYRHPTDVKRQEKLARLRVLNRKKRIFNNFPYHKERDDYTRPEKGQRGQSFNHSFNQLITGDILNWMEAYLKEIDKKHSEEREILLRVLQDPSLEELRSVADTQSTEELHQRLGELWAKRNKMDMEKEGVYGLIVFNPLY